MGFWDLPPEERAKKIKQWEWMLSMPHAEYLKRLAARKRRGRPAPAWAKIVEIVAAYYASGLTQQAFCELRGLSVRTLGAWIRQIQDKDSALLDKMQD